MTALRISFRRSMRHPGTLFASIASLAIGIGAVTAVHSVVDAALLRPLPGVSLDGLVAARQGDTRMDHQWYHHRDFVALRQAGGPFSGVAAFGGGRSALPIDTGDTAAPGAVLMVSAGYFEVLGVRLAAGRSFIAADDERDAAPTVVLAHHFWRARFREDPAAIGRVIRVGDVEATIVGVAPGEFRGTDLSRLPDVYLPIMLMPRVSPIGYEWLTEREPMWLQIVARLRPGLSRQAANEALAASASEWDDPRFIYVRDTRVIDIREAAIPPLLWNNVRTLISMFALAGSAILLVACLTVGTLLLVRGEERKTDSAVRLALGARPRRLVFEAWLEGLTPTIMGGLLAWPVAFAILAALQALVPNTGLRLGGIERGFNRYVLLGSIGTALIVSAIVTAVSCRAALTHSMTDVLRAADTLTLVTRRYARGILVLVQVASAMALLVGTLLLARSLSMIYAVDLGYVTDGLVEATIDTSTVRMTDDERRVMFASIDRELRAAMPLATFGHSGRDWLGVRASQILDQAPPGRDSSGAASSVRRGRSIHIRTVSPGYLEALGVKVIEGRTFAAGDVEADLASGASALISAALAGMIASGGSALGARLGPMAGEGRPQVIGVVSDIRLGALDPSRPTVYIPVGNLPRAATTSGIPVIAERIPRRATYTLRTADATTVGRIMRDAIRRWPSSVIDIVDTRQRLEREASMQRIGMMALGVLSATAVVLAMISIFVLIRSTMVARMREFGIRVALGATTRALGVLVARDTVLVVIAGLILGGVAMLSGARLLQRLLFGVQHTDPVSFLGAAALLLLVTLAVLVRPVVRTSRLDPARILREM